MDPHTFCDPNLPPADRLVLRYILEEKDSDVTGLRDNPELTEKSSDSGYESHSSASSQSLDYQCRQRIHGTEGYYWSGQTTRKEIDFKETLDGTDSSESSASPIIRSIENLKDPSHDSFEPNVCVSWDLRDLRRKLPLVLQTYLLEPYIRWASTIVRSPTDVVFVTHLCLYLATTIPSAICLYKSFSVVHGVAHLIMQLYYMGTYTLM